jgi:hypothetical protein
MAGQRYVSSYFRAQILGALGEREAGLAALRDSLGERCHQLIKIGLDPSLDPLRGEPGFDDVVRSVRPQADS